MKTFWVLTVAVLLLAGIDAEVFAGDVEKTLSSDVSECSRIVRRIVDLSKAGTSTVDDIARLKKSAEAIHADRLLLAERHGTLTERAAILGGRSSSRQDAISSSLLKKLDELLSWLDAIGTNATPTDLDGLRQILDTLVPHEPRPILGALPYKHANYPPREPVLSPLVKPAYKGGDRTVFAADTASTPEAPISREIVELAQSLQWNPVLIYEWVKNNVETEWYWGSMKGAEETLRQKSGNDADQATLLVALLRASGFPSRYIKGTIEFFPDIDKAKNLIGLSDPAKIASFLQKTGIPFNPVIVGGKIDNFRIEHVWVESFIPYSNYRGAVIDDHGKVWLGLDTSIKPQGYTRTEGTGAPAAILSSLWDEYLNTVQSLSPLDHLKGKLDAFLATGQPPKSWRVLKDSESQIADILKIIPSGLQFPQIAISGEYQTLPDELKHKVTFTATAGGGELFTITLDAQKLSNRKLELRAEPETVEDQNTIDSFGGLDNTPAYLVRLRPLLTIDGERIVVARDGLSMGANFTLHIDVVTPNGSERVTSSHIAGNLSVIGVVSQKALAPAPITEDDNAEDILHKTAIGYIDRWNKAEDDLAALLGQRISRPMVTIATVGGQAEVTILLDTPYDMQWKGLYLDAGFRRIESTGRNGLEKEYMRLSALQGSILENRIFEDGLKVDSVSAAKLLQLAKQAGMQIIDIDKTNIDSILPTLGFNDAVKADISNAVNQGLKVSIPQNEISYMNWSGIGYRKEDPATGEAGWMLSGNLAGGMTAVTPLQWVQQNFMSVLHIPYSGKVNRDPLSAKRAFVIGAANRQYGTVNTKLPQPLAVLVVDEKNMLVSGARVTFKTVTGGGGFDPTLSTTSITVLTDGTGIARVPFYLGKKTGENPIYAKLDSIDLEVTQMGLNLVTASVETAGAPVELVESFSSYAKPDLPIRILKVFGDNASNVANNPGGSLLVKVLDKYDNPVSNVVVQFESTRLELAKNLPQYGDPEPLPIDARPVSFYKPESCSVTYPIHGECPTTVILPRVSGYTGCFVNTILGDTVNTKYSVDVTIPGIPAIDKVSFTVFSEGYRNFGAYLPHTLLLRYLEQYTPEGYSVNATKVGKKLSTPLTAELLVYRDDYSMQSAGTCIKNILGSDYTYPCWRLVPSGKTIVQKVPKGQGSVVFNVTSGGGVVSTARDLGNGKYEADFTAGPVPERNQISTTGSARIKVPEVLYDTDTGKVILTGYAAESITMRDIDLPINKDILFNRVLNPIGGHDPIMRNTESMRYYTVFGVDTRLNIQPASIAITKDGRAKRDTAFTYTILPADYTSIISDIDFFAEDPLTGIEQWTFQLHGDKKQGQGSSIILAGSNWDIRKKHFARVKLNSGSTIEIDGDKIPVDIMLGALVPDYNHDRKIDPTERDRAEQGDKHYFWVNDDDGNGDTEGSGIPGSGAAIDSAHLKVNGTRDLVDFFPVHLDIKELLVVFDPVNYTYRLRNTDSALNYVVTDLGQAEAGEYLTGDHRGIDYARTMGEAPTLPITDTSFNAITAQTLVLKPEVIEQIKQGKGVILIEGYKRTSNPLVLEVYKGTTLAYSQRLNLSIDGVEQMFRHKNLSEAGGGPSPFPDEVDRLADPANFPDNECTGDISGKGKNFVFVHGYNVNAQQARGWNAEVFKRMYWSGSRAKFWGVTWYGWDTQVAVSDFSVTRNFHINVQHALKSVPEFTNFINWTVGRDGSEVDVAAHSLGNILTSSAIAENGAKVSNYFLLNAAVPMEAYDETIGKPIALTEPIDSSLNQMVVWGGYNAGLLASEWYRLFPSYDERFKLTWRGKFATAKDASNTYNFYSTGEDVLDNHSGEPAVPDIITKGVGRFAWGLQEKLKGKLPTGWMLGSNYGGWGINQDVYNEWIVDTAGHVVNVALRPENANQLTADEIKTKPFFKLTGDDLTLLQAYPIGSNYAKANHDRLISEAIPALSFAAGRNEVVKFNTTEEARNFDMNLRYKNDWPLSRSVDSESKKWKHSDLIEIAYPYVYGLFANLTRLGELGR